MYEKVIFCNGTNTVSSLLFTKTASDGLAERYLASARRSACRPRLCGRRRGAVGDAVERPGRVLQEKETLKTQKQN
jgi:hypothetical protein